MTRIEESLRQTCVIPVAVIDDAEDALPLVDALIAGGINALELALRTDAAPEAIATIAKERPGFILGAGTVLTPDQMRKCLHSGVKFAVSPGLSTELVRKAAELRLPYFPGVATPTEVQAAVALGCRVMKLFPAEVSGGVQLVRALHSVFGHLGVSYIPLGGLGLTEAAAYLEEPGILAVGGSWIAPRRAIANKDWTSIEQHAREAAALQLAHV